MPRVIIDAEEFHRLNADGWTAPELAEHYGVHPATISRHRKRHGINADTRRMMTPERRQAIQAMLDDGWSHAEISRTEGADPETLRKHFPGTAWTTKQRAAHLSALRVVNIHFNRRPQAYDQSKYAA